LGLLQKLADAVRQALVRLRRVDRAATGDGKVRFRAPSRGSPDFGNPVASPVSAELEERATAADSFATATIIEGAASGDSTANERVGNTGQFRELGFNCEAGSRRFKIYLPSRPPSAAMPLVVMLHGCSQTPDDFALGTRMNSFAERDGFAVAYPAQSRTHNVTRCWNWFRPEDQSRGAGEPEIIASLTRDLVRRYGLDAERVYVAGLSAGGAMAAILGDVYHDIYAAVGVHSSVPHGIAVGMASGLALMRHGRAEAAEVPGGARDAGPGAPVIVFHGDADTTVNPRNAAEVYARSTQFSHANRASRYLGLSESLESGKIRDGHGFTRTRWIGSDGVAMSELWVVHESGHAWSGGDARGSFTDPKGPDASAEMLRFFLRHRLRNRHGSESVEAGR
jgi:poly(hydroxyalkanoate) depolymerase family esterase